MISDKVQEQRLRQKNTVIVTDYYDNGAARTRSSDHTKADDVRSGVILAKKYFLRGKMVHQETEFNPGMLYSFVFPVLDNGQIQCPNCGGTGENALFEEGCPYCGAYYNMEYQSELLGSRDHSDYVIEERKVILIPLLLIMTVFIVLGIGLSLLTGRTATVFDYGKGALIGGIIGGLVFLCYAVHKYRAALTQQEITKKREQDVILTRFHRDLAANGLTMGEFANCLNLGLRDYYFGSDSEQTRDVVDFDVLEYRDQQVSSREGEIYVTAGVRLRLVSAEGEQIRSEIRQKRIRMKKGHSAGLHMRPGLNISTCPYCGASVDLTSRRCTYCGTAFLFERPLNMEQVYE